MESRNIMFSQINNNREILNDVQNFNVRLEKVEKKLDEVVHSVEEMSNQVTLLISAINDANNIVLC